jgi:hypothetical protein
MYVFNNELDYCKHDFAKIKQTFMSNSKNPVLDPDPEQQAVVADPDPAKMIRKTPVITLQYQDLPSYLPQKRIFQISTY